VVGPNGSGKVISSTLCAGCGEIRLENSELLKTDKLYFRSRTVKPLGMADIEVWWKIPQGQF
jgi:hypothetical protein